MTADVPLNTRLPMPVLIAVLGLGTVVVSMMQTLVVPVLGLIQQDLRVSTTDATWLTTATLLAAAVCTPLAGRLGDQYGARRVLLAVLALTVAGSVVAALSSALPWLIVARAMQGISTAIFPLAQSVLRHRLPAGRLPAAMGAISAALAIGNGVALASAGLLGRESTSDYHLVFWLAAIVSGLALAATAMVLPATATSGVRHTDWLGAVLLAGVLVLLLLPLSRGSDWGWSSPRTLGCLGGALLLGAVWVDVERRRPDPVVNLRIAARPAVALANLAGFLLGFAMFMQFIGVSAVVQIPAAPAGYGLGASVSQAALEYLLPPAVASLFAARVAGALTRRVGARRTLAAGSATGVAGFALLAAVHGCTTGVLVGGVLVGIAVSFGFAALPAVLLDAVPLTQTAAANGVNSVFRSIGSSVASALLGVLLATGADASASTPAAPPAEGRFTLAFALAGAAFAVVAALALPRRRRHTRIASQGATPGAPSSATSAGPLVARSGHPATTTTARQ
ncbi:MFS transporter [Micromonospora avicenniae]|uniref:Major Facilitator Superfamily protein n=1 Tax=Micromonospora avicenniae TaxID=1198245 RepID=A0A1N7A002_9ACTN|nr:MFS transporter [Micromonospora avicenniae]SIR32391.1 Major Facilitator Superfamily protein [Micromonospora avicenniae]